MMGQGPDWRNFMCWISIASLPSFTCIVYKVEMMTFSLQPWGNRQHNANHSIVSTPDRTALAQLP